MLDLVLHQRYTMSFDFSPMFFWTQITVFVKVLFKLLFQLFYFVNLVFRKPQNTGVNNDVRFIALGFSVMSDRFHLKAP